MVALCCAVLGGVVTGCDEVSPADQGSAGTPASSTTRPTEDAGPTTVDVDGRSVHVSCAGGSAEDRPVLVLMAGLADGLDKMADLQQTLSADDRVCSYDRLGEGESDQPDGPQDLDSTGKVLGAVLDEVAGDRPVVLVGHSLGGMIAARYAPGDDRVAGLVLLDATPVTTLADTTRLIPASATGPGAELRAQTLAVYAGQNPEQLVLTEAPVATAGDIPVEVIQHGKPYLTAVPEYGAALEQAWADGQRAWLALSRRGYLTTATDSGHYVYVDQPDLAVQAVRRIVAQVGA